MLCRLVTAHEESAPRSVRHPSLTALAWHFNGYPMNQDGSAVAPARHVTPAQFETIYTAEYPSWSSFWWSWARR
jgi:hypothetical protein